MTLSAQQAAHAGHKEEGKACHPPPPAPQDRLQVDGAQKRTIVYQGTIVRGYYKDVLAKREVPGLRLTSVSQWRPCFEIQTLPLQVHRNQGKPTPVSRSRPIQCCGPRQSKTRAHAIIPFTHSIPKRPCVPLTCDVCCLSALSSVPQICSSTPVISRIGSKSQLLTLGVRSNDGYAAGNDISAVNSVMGTVNEDRYPGTEVKIMPLWIGWGPMGKGIGVRFPFGQPWALSAAQVLTGLGHAIVTRACVGTHVGLRPHLSL